MAVMSMEIRDGVGEFFPTMDLQRTRDALARYVALRWPVGRRKAVMTEWDLNDDEARSVCSGRASWQTFDKIIFHKRGRWAVVFPIFGALLDETAAQHFIKMRKAHEDDARRLGALVGDLWPEDADRSFDPAHGHLPHHQRRGHLDDRGTKGRRR